MSLILLPNLAKTSVGNINYITRLCDPISQKIPQHLKETLDLIKVLNCFRGTCLRKVSDL